MSSNESPYDSNMPLCNVSLSNDDHREQIRVILQRPFETLDASIF